MVLLPGFEPGSSPREGDMMGRTTPHERQVNPNDLSLSKRCTKYDIFTFTFTEPSRTFIDMLSFPHRGMNEIKCFSNNVIYRKKLEPCRIVPLGALIQTRNPINNNDPSDGIFVNYTGSIVSDADAWMPLRKEILPIEVGTTSWVGLRKRLRESKINYVEVF